MNIDLNLLDNNTMSTIDINKEVIIPKDYYENTDINDLKNLTFIGKLDIIENNLSLTGTLTGIMVIDDSISLEPINHEFSIEIDEEIDKNLIKLPNILDITLVLWQNIVLEVPLRLTNVSNFDEYHGDGWKLISEDSTKSTNNPFKELEDMLGKE